MRLVDVSKVIGNILKLRENLDKCQILNDYRNAFVAAGKPSWYSKNSDNRDNPQAKVTKYVTKLQRLNRNGENQVLLDTSLRYSLLPLARVSDAHEIYVSKHRNVNNMVERILHKLLNNNKKIKIINYNFIFFMGNTYLAHVFY
jgi:hypothetical protein